jgi:ABC-2 type transport system permease protein
MRIVSALWLRGLKSFWRNKFQLIMTVAFPFFFLYVFSSVFKIDHIENPVNYMLAGIVITGVFQTGLSFAAGTITDIVSGFMKEVLVSPVRRVHIALGQLLSAATIATVQGILVLIIGFFIGLRFSSAWTPLLTLGVMILVGVVFAAFGLLLAALVKNAQTYQVLEMSITMPLTFLCGAYLPISMLPAALQVVAYLNPMTYTTAFFRAVILEKTHLAPEQMVLEQIAFQFGGLVVTPWMSLLMILAFGVLFLLLAAWVFSRVDFSRMNRTKVSEGDIWA